MAVLLGTQQGEQVFVAITKLAYIDGRMQGYLASQPDATMIPETLKEIQRELGEARGMLDEAYYGKNGR